MKTSLLVAVAVAVATAMVVAKAAIDAAFHRDLILLDSFSIFVVSNVMTP